MLTRYARSLSGIFALPLLFGAALQAADPVKKVDADGEVTFTVSSGPSIALPTLFEEDFEKGADRWSPSDEKAWKIVDTIQGKGKAYSLFKPCDFKPPHRSPTRFALVKDLYVSDFQLDVKAFSTIKDYNHRDLCLFFGYQDPGHHYYVHLAKKTDDRANQIFIVDGKDRAKISTKTTPGTEWGDSWHNLRITRYVHSGEIAVFFDDMKTPVMTANDKTFTWGQVGIGSFDDLGDFDDVKVSGTKVERPATAAATPSEKK